MTLSPNQIAAHARTRLNTQNWRIKQYATYLNEYTGFRSQGGGVRGSYADGRPALQDLDAMHGHLQNRPGAPNWIKPIIDDAVAVSSKVPVITFDPESDMKEARDRATLVSRAVRGQYDLSQMEVFQAQAIFYAKTFGEVCYTLDPLKPKDAKAMDDPFALPGVYINVQDPSICFPKFGIGREVNHVQDLYMVYSGKDADDLDSIYPDAVQHFDKEMKIDIIVYYGKKEKVIVLSQGDRAYEAFRDDHNYGFCPAEWGINKVTNSQWGSSEIDQTVDLHRVAQAQFHLATDAAIMATFPPVHVHNAEHVGKLTYGPLAIIPTSEDGSVEMLNSNVDVHVPLQLLGMSSDNLFKQTGVSPIRIEGNIQHANTSGRAMAAAQGPMEARLAMSNTLIGSTLQRLNSKIALILFKDPAFKKAEMSVHGTDNKGARSAVTFTGEMLGGLWRNHVHWPSLIGGSVHEDMVIYLQLQKDNLVPGRKVLEVIGEDDPEGLIAEAKQERMAMMQEQAAMQGSQGGPAPGGGGPPSGPPNQAASEGNALAQGAMPGRGGAPPPPIMSPGPAQPQGGMPGFPPLPGAPNSGPPQMNLPDIWGLVQQTAGQMKLHGEIVGAVGTKDGILVTVTDGRDLAMIKTALKAVAQEVAGPQAVVHVQVQGAK